MAQVDELGAVYRAMNVDELISLCSCAEGGLVESSRIFVKEDESESLWIFSHYSCGTLAMEDCGSGKY